MVFITAAILSLTLGIFVVLNAEERRVRLWFFLMCIGCAMLPVGQWVETTFPDLVFAGARCNMTAGVMIASFALLSVRIMSAMPVHLPVILLLGAAATVNIATVWVTDAYFNSEVRHYPWGTYISANPLFMINPLLVAAIATYGLCNLFAYSRNAHPMERTRRLYIFAAYGVLTLSTIDYLPHYGIDPFGGMISPFAIPVFLTLFAYACLRYRLMGFPQAMGKASLQVMIALMVAGSFFLANDIIGKLYPGRQQSFLAIPAGVAVLLFALLEKTIPAWANRWFGEAERRLQEAVARLGEELISILDESLLMARVEALFTGSFGSAFVRFVDPAQMRGSSLAHPARGLVDCEVLRRTAGHEAVPGIDCDLLAPLVHKQTVLGGIGIGKRLDGAAYSLASIRAMRSIGNLVTVALASARAAAELEKRHELDRYLSPQVIDEIMQGNASALVERHRAFITVFFSDLKDFSAVADHLEPDKLSAVLNEYFSEMAEIAFRHGGLVDKFIGDAVMVLYGTPLELPQEEQVRRAVTMAVEMQARLISLNARWVADGLLTRPFACRMGIHTGEATVGSFGSRSRAEYTAIGRTVNLASRLEGKCTPGRVLISEYSHKLLEGGFETVPRGEIEVKGFDRPVGAWEVIPAL